MGRTIKHIYWFAPFNLSCPSTRYRGVFPLQYFREHLGISADFFYPERSLSKLLQFIRIYLGALLFRKRNSLIVVQKVSSNGRYAKALQFLIRKQQTMTMYDLDDADYLRNHKPTIDYFIAHCSYVSVGSEALKSYAKAFNPNVFVLTSPIKDHGVVKVSKNEVLHVGWAGDYGNGNPIVQEYNNKRGMTSLFFPALKQIAFPLKVTLLGVKTPSDIPEIQALFKDNKNIELHIPEGLNWENDDWLFPEIAKFDIGVAPMVDHEFTRAKSAFKSKQYMSVGVPAVSSDVGENRNYIIPSETGFICKNIDDFVRAITEVHQMSSQEYKVFSDKVRSRYNDYSVKHYCNTLLENLA